MQLVRLAGWAVDRHRSLVRVPEAGNPALRRCGGQVGAIIDIFRIISVVVRVMSRDVLGQVVGIVRVLRDLLDELLDDFFRISLVPR